MRELAWARGKVPPDPITDYRAVGLMAKPPRPEPELPPDLLLWRRLTEFVPAWAWMSSAVAVLVITVPFWLHWSPAPYHDIHGDVYRGWPLPYGLDQGDVRGDDWGPFVTDFRPGRFALDTAVGVVGSVPATVLLLWAGRRSRRTPSRPA